MGGASGDYVGGGWDEGGEVKDFMICFIFFHIMFVSYQIYKTAEKVMKIENNIEMLLETNEGQQCMTKKDNQ